MCKFVGPWLFFFGIALSFLSCATKEPPFEAPEVVQKDVRIDRVTFSGIDLTATLELFNPNPGAVDLAGLDYDLTVSGTSILQGSRNERTSLPAQGSRTVQIPLTVRYQDLFGRIAPAAGRERYRMTSVLRWVLPGQEERRIEAVSEGDIPLVQPPRFRFKSLYVKDLGMMGADIVVQMETENPNPFGISLADFQGTLVVNDERWSEIEDPEALLLPSGETVGRDFTIRLEFLSMGKTVRDLLSGEKALFYHFTGETLAEAPQESLKEEVLPLELAGEILLYKPDSTVEGRHSSVKIEQSIEDNLLHLFGAYSP